MKEIIEKQNKLIKEGLLALKVLAKITSCVGLHEGNRVANEMIKEVECFIESELAALESEQGGEMNKLDELIFMYNLSDDDIAFAVEKFLNID